MTVADRTLQEHVEAHQKTGVPIRVSRLIGINPRDALLAEAGASQI